MKFQMGMNLGGWGAGWEPPFNAVYQLIKNVYLPAACVYGCTVCALLILGNQALSLLLPSVLLLKTEGPTQPLLR